MSIRQLVHRMVHNSPGKVSGVLDFLNIGRTTKLSEQVLINKLNFNSDTHHMYIQELEAIADVTNSNLLVAQFFAHKANAVVVQLPDVSESDMAILDDFLQITKELGDVAHNFQKAYADGEIDKIDQSVLANEIDEAVSALLTFKTRIDNMVRNG